MIKIAIGVLIAFLIGASCRWFQIPVPAPPTWVGALLVASITLGYLTADRLLPPVRESPNDETRMTSQ